MNRYVKKPIAIPYIYLLDIFIAEEDLDLMKYVSKHDCSFVPKI